MGMTNLTKQRQVFVEEYVRLGEHLEAAKKTGYKDTYTLRDQTCMLRKEFVEEITGEIEDEHDVSYNLILDGNPDGSVIVDARIAVLELEKHYNCKLLASSMEVDTLGGWAENYNLRENKSTEEFIVSPKHGLKGKIDLVLKDDENRCISRDCECKVNLDGSGM